MIPTRLFRALSCHFLKHMKHFLLKSRAQHLTRARATCASNDRLARETREQIEARAREVPEQG